METSKQTRQFPTRQRSLYFVLLLGLTVYSSVRNHGYEKWISFDGSEPHPESESNSTSFPEIVWLLSYPNSGTSYTMMLTEVLSNYSTASNYGVEVAKKFSVSPPVHDDHPEGPFWEGLSTGVGKTVRELPPKYVLTKTHCGGRCVDCGPESYVVTTEQFLEGCARTTARVKGVKRRVESKMNPKRVSRMVHLFRNPIHNTISRFHLSRRHLIAKDSENRSRKAREISIVQMDLGVMH